MNQEDDRPTILQNTEDIITHLPEELLECIMLKLNYDEILNDRRFRDTGTVYSTGSSAVLKIVLKDCWPIL
jgi:hypothetical protein